MEKQKRRSPSRFSTLPRGERTREQDASHTGTSQEYRRDAVAELQYRSRATTVPYVIYLL